MPLKTLVKVGNITNLSDARYCAGMGVDLLGFRVVEGQEGFISPKQYQEIRGWVTGPQIVAEIYGLNSPEQIGLIIEQYQPDYLELGVDELNNIGASLTLPFILDLRAAQPLSAQVIKPAYVLIDEKTIHLEKVVGEYDVLVEVSSVESVNSVIHRTGIVGIALNGGNEIRPGLKAFDHLAEILEHLEADE